MKRFKTLKPWIEGKKTLHIGCVKHNWQESLRSSWIHAFIVKHSKETTGIDILEEDVKELVKLRLMATPSNIRISIGHWGEFTKEQLMEEVDKGSAVGNAAIEMELLFIRKMASISRRIACEEG